MAVPNLFVFGFINILGSWFLYKPITRLFDDSGKIEQACTRINQLTKYSTIWIFCVGVMSGFALLIGVFVFQTASEVATMEMFPPFS